MLQSQVQQWSFIRRDTAPPWTCLIRSLLLGPSHKGYATKSARPAQCTEALIRASLRGANIIGGSRTQWCLLQDASPVFLILWEYFLAYDLIAGCACQRLVTEVFLHEVNGKQDTGCRMQDARCNGIPTCFWYPEPPKVHGLAQAPPRSSHLACL